MPPSLGNGKVCDLEIPTADIARSVRFYQAVFGWHNRRRGDGAIADAREVTARFADPTETCSASIRSAVCRPAPE